VCSTAKFLPPRFGRKGRALHGISNGEWCLNKLFCQASALRLNEPLFLYSHIEHMALLWEAMRPREHC